MTMVTINVPAAANEVSPKVQSALVALADLDHRYAVECEYLTGWQGPTPARERLIGQIEARYRKDRELLVQRLADLQKPERCALAAVR